MPGGLNVPAAMPPDHAGDRLHPAIGGEPVGTGGPGAGPGGGGLRGVDFGRRASPSGDGADRGQRGDAQRFAQAEPGRLCGGHVVAAAGGPAPPPSPAASGRGQRPSGWSRRRRFAGSTCTRCWKSSSRSPGGWTPPWKRWPNCAAANGPTPTRCRERRPAPPASASPPSRCG